MLAGISLSFNNARKNALAEIASAERSALYLFNSVMQSAVATGKQKIDLGAFKLHQLSHMRHLKIELLDKQNKVLDSNHADRFNNEAPAWFERILNKTMPKWQPIIKTLSINNQLLAKLIITPDPSYEYAEIWKQMTDLLVLLALFFVCVNLMIAWAIAQALKPTETILSALDEIEKGHMEARLPQFQLPELARIGQKFNHMIETLQQSIYKNHALTQQLMTLQEAERKSLARDLHDEFGQCLTAINTDANVILKRAKIKYPELHNSALAITQLSRHLTDLVSGLLQRLRPGVLDELGLAVALHDLIDGAQARQTAVKFQLSIVNAEALEKNNVGETESLVIYRLVQECLTNIARHAVASQVNINVTPQQKSSQQGFAINVSDNGKGFILSEADGFGLLGMRERVEGLGGDFAIDSSQDKGTHVSAWIPTGTLQ
jgi:two-component system, NarL family, sensor histidine kinase UhpB